MKAVNDLVRFLVELGALFAVGWWGFHEHAAWVAKLLFGLGGPFLVAAVWGRWMAPRSPHRAPEGTRAVLEVLIFGLATAALVASGATGAGVVFAVVAGVNAVLDHVLARRAPGSVARGG